MNNLNQLCSECSKTPGEVEVQGSFKNKCNNSKMCAYNVFTSNKHEILEFNANSKFETYKHSFLNFITAFRACEIQSKTLINSMLADMVDYYDTYSVDLYKKIDLFVSKWDSWFSRFSLFLKHMMVNGYLCESVEDVLIATITDYNEVKDFSTEIDDILVKYIIQYIKDLKLVNPVENGEYTNTLITIHKLLLNIYSILFVQYIQEDRIYNLSSNVLYYNTNYSTLSPEFEKELLEFRIKQLLTKWVGFKVIKTDIIEVKLNETKLNKYKQFITNPEILD